MREREQALPAMPSGEPAKRIGADEQDEWRLRVSVAKLGEGVDGVAHSPASNLAGIYGKPRKLADRDLEHRDAIRGTRSRHAAVRWSRRGHQAHFGEAERRARFRCEAEVAVVDRIERAAEERDRLGTRRSGSIFCARSTLHSEARVRLAQERELVRGRLPP